MPAFDWTALPAGLRYGLLLGGEGKPHLTALAQMALSSPETARLGLDLLLAAWEAGPLDGGLARAVLDLDARAGFLAKPQRSMIAAVANNWARPQDTGLMAGLAAGRQHEELLIWLSRRVALEPANLFWRQHLLDVAYLLADWDQALKALRDPWPARAQEIRDKILGDRAFQLADHAEAARAYGRARRLRPARVRAGVANLCLGRPNKALQLLDRSQAHAPWNVNLLLRRHDLRFLEPAPAGRSGGLCASLAVCLYTTGKAQEIHATLAALAACGLGGARLVVLDNGSQDATPQVLAAWKDRLGEKLEVISLPVNVGAPAARNWLMRHPAVAKAEFTAYLDDDARVPPDWLGRFGEAVRVYPGAGVWGCKVVDEPVPARIQNIDIHFLDQAGEEPAFSSLCGQDLDFGQFDYLRPCLSVTGCCHLLRTRDLLESGGFDIRFSPTQYDDVDHDLRLAASGKWPVYQGRLGVAHARLSGALLNVNAQATANSRGNLAKLSGKYPTAERERLRGLDSQAMLDDVLAKQARLEQV